MINSDSRKSKQFQVNAQTGTTEIGGCSESASLLQTIFKSPLLPFNMADIVHYRTLNKKKSTTIARSNSTSDSRLHAFNPSGIFQGFVLPLPFRRKNSQSRMEDGDHNFDNNEHIELAHFGHIIFDRDPDPISTRIEIGIGHDFRPSQLKNPTWCDKCGDFIWGLYKQCLRCHNCNYTCHHRCRELITLDCKNAGENRTTEIPSAETSLIDINDKDEEEICTSLPGHITKEELRKKIEGYNIRSQGLEMTLEEDGEAFRGFIRVHMNLYRPINVVAGTRPPSIYDIIYEDNDTSEKTMTSFFLPRDTVKALHVTSDTTTQEVIVNLLKKFKVADNPRKFALYERYLEYGNTGQVKMRRLSDFERPLVLALMWGNDGMINKRFVLQENETGDIMWEAFTLPELNNFLRILDREEDEYLSQVRTKYKLMQQRIVEQMQKLKPKEQKS